MGFDENPNKSHSNPYKHWVLSGRSAGTRTLDPLIKSQLLYQLSYTSIKTDPETGVGAKKMERAKGVEPSTITLAR
jgi:hypothetical protein